MSESNMDVKIKLLVKGVEIELTKAEAVELKSILEGVVGEPKSAPLYIPYPVREYPWPRPVLWETPWVPVTSPTNISETICLTLN